ncbi:MAG: NAD(P)/FAD-dependent oxidoreductase [Armatimonadetes bacterium]|nr:NAD(P)/FAD-dependent oxidoreductase [Armatimonadota bacterium]
MKKRVVIVGSGFGGLNCAVGLSHSDCDVVLIDKENHFLFQPLLYQVATAGLSPADIAWPIRSLLRKQKNVTVLMDRVTHIDTAMKTVRHEHGSEPYDALVIATGATHSFFGHDDWEVRSQGLKTLDDATRLRTRVLTAFEEAELTMTDTGRTAWLTFVIVGGGPTGVELAGSLAELSKRTMAAEFRRMDPAQARILLIEATEILSAYPADLREAARHSLHKLGVEVLEKTTVTAVTDDGVEIASGPVRAKNVIWAAGVTASPAATWLSAGHDRSGRVIVDDHCRVPDKEGVFVIGDVAAFSTADGKGLPGVAQVAMQQGRYVARLIEGKERGAFRYKDLGTMATIGRSSAVAVVGGRHFRGFVAWMMWSGLHIWTLLTAQSRILVFVQWAWAYFTFWRGARLITRKP